jgi:hypothetical protein
MAEQNFDYINQHIETNIEKDIEGNIEENIRNYEKVMKEITARLTRVTIKRWYEELYQTIREVTKKSSILKVIDFYNNINRNICLEIDYVINMIGEDNLYYSRDDDYYNNINKIEDPTEEELSILEDLVNIKYAFCILEN